jgi:ABC-type multidrug transport system ATPase subunit
LLGLLPCDGQLTLAGFDLRREGLRARSRLGYVPQELRFHGDMTVRETMEFYASLREVRHSECAPALERVGLGDHSAKLVSQLSGGMKQRLALALALLGDPPVLLLDEPTSNLDLQARSEFLSLLCSLKAQGKTMLFSAHHLEELAPLADRVVLLEQGHIARVSSVKEMVRSCA